MKRSPLRAELDYYGILRSTHLLMWEVDAKRNDREYGYRLRWRQFYDTAQAGTASPWWGVDRIHWRDDEIHGSGGEPIAYPFHWPGHCASIFPPERIAALEDAGWTVTVTIYEPVLPPRPVTFAAAPANTRPTSLGASCINCHVSIRRPNTTTEWRHDATRSIYCPEIHPGYWQPGHAAD